MKLLLGCSLLLAISPLARLDAAEGVSREWTDVADADRVLMGDYEGQWLDAPRGHYYDINPPLAAQVVNVRPGEYRVQFFQEHDRRAEPYFDGTGTLEGEVIRFEAQGFKGQISKNGITGSATINDQGQAVTFRLKKTVRSSPTLGAKPPKGAVVLFDGRSFDAWKHTDGRPVTWHLTGSGAMEVPAAADGIGGDIQTKEVFGDCTLHVEFRYPVEPGKVGQARGNSGVFLQNDYEVQVLNSYGLEGRWNECGALYKCMPPQVNAARPPMEWQTYDIDYKSSVWKKGRKISSPRITVRLNGVTIHQDVEISHVTAHAFAQRFREPKKRGPIRLQDHSNAIQYRNLWVLPR